MRRGIWVGAAILVAFAAAIPLWMAVGGDDGERNQAALTQAPRPVLDCSRARAQGCQELNALLADFDRELEGSQRSATIAATQAAIEENALYKTAVLGELSEQDMLALQRHLQKQAELMATLSNVAKKHYETQQAIIQNMKG